MTVFSSHQHTFVSGLLAFMKLVVPSLNSGVFTEIEQMISGSAIYFSKDIVVSHRILNMKVVWRQETQ